MDLQWVCPAHVHKMPLFLYIIIIHHVQEGFRFDSCSFYPQNEIGPSISSSVVLSVFVLLVYIVVLV